MLQNKYKHAFVTLFLVIVNEIRVDFEERMKKKTNAAHKHIGVTWDAKWNGNYTKS